MTATGDIEAPRITASQNLTVGSTPATEEGTLRIGNITICPSEPDPHFEGAMWFDGIDLFFYGNQALTHLTNTQP